MESSNRAGGTGKMIWAALAAIAAAAAAVIVLVLVTGDDDEGEETVADPDPAATLVNVAEATGQFLNERVTVSGRVSETIVSGAAFALEADGSAVVVVPRAGTILPPIGPDDTAIATGVVYRMDESDLALDVDPALELDFESEPFDDYRDLAVIVAADVDEVIPEAVDLDPAETLANLVARPAQFYGEPVVLSGEVGPQQIEGEAFVLGESPAGQVLVLPAPEAAVAAVDANDVVTVIGVARPFERAAEQDRLMTELDLEAEALDPFRGGPVVVATEADELVAANERSEIEP
jgi:hypothetical protein